MSSSCGSITGPLCSAVHRVVGDTVGRAVSHSVQATAHSVLSAVAGWVASGAGWLLGQVGNALTSTTAVNVGAPWFLAHERAMAALAATIAVPVLIGALIQALLRQDVGIALRAAFVHLPLAFLLTGVAVQLVAMGLAVTDQLSAAVAGGSSGALHHTLERLVASSAALTAAGQPAVPALVTVLVGLLAAFGALTLWLELLVRAAAIYVAVLFLPVALVSVIWPAIAHWAHRLVHTLVALLVSKFVIVAVLSLAAGAIAAGTRGPGAVSTLLWGTALLLLATFVPFVLLRLVPMAEGAALLEGARSRTTHSVAAPPRMAARLALRYAAGTPVPGSIPGTGGSGAFEAPGAGGHGLGARFGDEAGSAGSRKAGGRGGDSASQSGKGGRGRRERDAPSTTGAATEGPGLVDAQAPADDRAPAVRGGQGSGGVPLWRGDPGASRAFEEALAAGASGREDTEGEPRPRARGVPRRGGPPVWGAPLADDDGGGHNADGQVGDDGGDAPALVIGRDELGPVIRRAGGSRVEPGASRPASSEEVPSGGSER